MKEYEKMRELGAETWLNNYLNKCEVKEGTIFTFKHQKWVELWKTSTEAA